MKKWLMVIGGMIVEAKVSQWRAKLVRRCGFRRVGSGWRGRWQTRGCAKLRKRSWRLRCTFPYRLVAKTPPEACIQNLEGQFSHINLHKGEPWKNTGDRINAVAHFSCNCTCTGFHSYSSKIFMQPQIYSTSGITEKCATALIWPL